METRPEEELAYIKYSAKELLFHQGQKLESLQSDVNQIKLNMVTRAELTAARRWAIGAVIGSAGTLLAFVRFLGI